MSVNLVLKEINVVTQWRFKSVNQCLRNQWKDKSNNCFNFNIFYSANSTCQIYLVSIQTRNYIKEDINESFDIIYRYSFAESLSLFDFACSLRLYEISKLLLDLGVNIKVMSYWMWFNHLKYYIMCRNLINLSYQLLSMEIWMALSFILRMVAALHFKMK